VGSRLWSLTPPWRIGANFEHLAPDPHPFHADSGADPDPWLDFLQCYFKKVISIYSGMFTNVTKLTNC